MSDPAIPKKVIFYTDDNGKEPFAEWHEGLRDGKGRRFILRCIRKLERGIGKHKSIGDGVSELRDRSHGPGYRIYIGEHGDTVVVLLGGDKASQNSDIQKAKDYWKEYKNYEKL